MEAAVTCVTQLIFNRGLTKTLFVENKVNTHLGM